MLAAGMRGESALLVAATGAGKTLSGFLPTLVDLAEHPSDRLHTLYVSPLKALAADVERNLTVPIAEMALDISVESRSGDTSSDKKARQRSRPPNILLTTPESLSLLLSYPDSFTMFADLKTVVIDEIHAFAPGTASAFSKRPCSQSPAPPMRSSLTMRLNRSASKLSMHARTRCRRVAGPVARPPFS